MRMGSRRRGSITDVSMSRPSTGLAPAVGGMGYGMALTHNDPLWLLSLSKHAEGAKI